MNRSVELRKLDGDIELLIARIASITTHVNELHQECIELLGLASDLRARWTEEADETRIARAEWEREHGHE